MSTKIARSSLSAKPLFYKDWHDTGASYLRHHHERKNLSWGTTIEERMTPSDNGGQVAYIVNSDMHYLEQCFMRWQTKALRLKPEFADFVRIAYTPMIMHNIVASAEMHLDSVKLPMNSKIMDIHSEWNMKPDMREEYMLNVGNKPQLIDWNTELPSEILECPQWWYFTESSFQAVPVFMTEKGKIKFTYNFRTKLTDLVRMKVNTRMLDSHETGQLKVRP